MKLLLTFLFSFLLFAVYTQEVCNNGVDDDGDTLIDCDDPDCIDTGNIFPIREDFDGGTFDNPNWVLTGSAYLNTDWLRLTDDESGQSGNAFLNETFVSTSHIIVEFDYATIDYNGANCTFGIGDGLAFFLTDGTASPSIGQPGGSLGYSHGTTGDPNQGIDGGFLGIALDEFGNFSGNLAGPIECARLGGDVVTIRGEETNNNLTAYPCLGTTLLPGNASVDVSSRSEARRVRIILAPNGILDMYIDLNDGLGLQPVFTNLATGQTVPSTFKLGFCSSTGGACIAHEINDVVVAKPADIEVNIEAPDTFNICDSVLSYTITATNNGPNNAAGIFITDLIDGLTQDISWTCVDCLNNSGGGSNTIQEGVDIAIGETITLIVELTVNPNAAGTVITNHAAIDFGCTDLITSNINNSSDSITTFVTQLPFELNLGNDTSLCELPFNLAATTFGGVYNWQDGSTANSFEVNSAGTYWVDVSVGQCTVRDSIVIIDNSFDLDLGGNRTLCDGSFILDALTTGATYLWQDGSTNSSFNVSQAGDYWVAVSIGDCSLVDSVSVTDDSFEIDLGNDTTICNSSLVLNATTVDATYLWQDGSTNPTYIVSNGGQYSVIVSIGNCSASDDIFVTDNSFDLDLGGNRTLCNGGFMLDATTAGATYSWQDGSTNSTFNVSQAGEYWVSVSIGECFLSDSVIVTDDSFEIDLGNDTSICNSSLILDATTVDATYLWQDGSTNPTLTLSSGGQYSVTVSIGNCSASDEIIVSDNSLSISLGGDQSTCETSLLLDASVSGGSYLWQDSSMASTFLATQDGVYSVTVDANNCISESSVSLTFLTCIDCNYFAPKAFSPNGDGTNDVFSVFFDCNIENFEIEIFNRWGEKVFNSVNPQEGWDGYINGSKGLQDVYTWKARYDDEVESNKMIFGSILLLR